MSRRPTAWRRLIIRLLLVGNPEPIHVGHHFFQAARALGADARLCDSSLAFGGNRLKQAVIWRFLGHRPARLGEFSRHVLEACLDFHPNFFLGTGIAPVDAGTLKEIGRRGILRINYLTDDPWNPNQKGEWFFKALVHYDRVYSVRRSNVPDLERLGCRGVDYLPFAYNPELHYPEHSLDRDARRDCEADVVFAGGADRDRLPYIRALIESGLKLKLYGAYWERWTVTRSASGGHADPGVLRRALGTAKVALCLLRRANRDGNSMRSFEVPAMGACPLMEDSGEHREIFGEEGKRVVYFNSVDEMVKKARWLIECPDERARLARAAHESIVNGGNTYEDRLKTMVGIEKR